MDHAAVAQSARGLTEEGIEDDARVRIYSVQPAALQPVQQWLTQIEELWRGQLHAFKVYAESSQRGRRAKQ